MKSNSFQQRVVFFEQISCKTHFIARHAYNLAKVVFNTKWSQTQFSTASCILWARLMQNAFFSKISLKFGNRKFLTQNEVQHNFQQRVVFFEKISCETHILARHAYNLAKCSFEHKIKSNTVFNSGLYSLNRFHAKRIF